MGNATVTSGGCKTQLAHSPRRWPKRWDLQLRVFALLLITTGALHSHPFVCAAPQRAADGSGQSGVAAASPSDAFLSSDDTNGTDTPGLPSLAAAGDAVSSSGSASDNMAAISDEGTGEAPDFENLDSMLHWAISESDRG